MIMRNTFAAILALAALPTCVPAQDFKAVREACREDYKKLCANVTPGGGRGKQCLTENVDKLGPSCKEILTDAQAKAKS